MMVNFPIRTDSIMEHYIQLNLDLFELKTSTWNGRNFIKSTVPGMMESYWIPEEFGKIENMAQLKMHCDLMNPYVV